MGFSYQLQAKSNTKLIKMGHVRTKTVKKAARVIIEKYYMKLTLDFHSNKRVCEEIAHIPSKRLRNQIAGFVTHLIRESKKDQSVESPSSFRRKNVNVVITTSQRCPLWTKKSAKSTKPLRTCWPLSTSVTSPCRLPHPTPKTITTTAATTSLANNLSFKMCYTERNCERCRIVSIFDVNNKVGFYKLKPVKKKKKKKKIGFFKTKTKKKKKKKKKKS